MNDETDYASMTVAQLDHAHEALLTPIEGWSSMNKAAKVEALTAAAAAVDENPTVEDPPLDDMPKGTVEITVTNAMADPVPLYIHGVGRFSLRVGVPQIIPEEAVQALHDANVQFDIKEA